MDPATVIETAAVAGASALALRGAGKVIENESVVLWERFKAAIAQKLGAKNKLSTGIEMLEGDPNSSAGVLLLKEGIRETNADQNVDILAAAQQLIDRIQVKQIITGKGTGVTLYGNVTLTNNWSEPKPQP